MTTKTISLPEELLQKGLEQAKKDHRPSFSNYVQRLIERDVEGQLPVKEANESEENQQEVTA